MNEVQAVSAETVSGRIESFRKLTPTLATFRVDRIACKAEYHAVAFVERWSKSPDSVYIFDGHYQQSRFGREFVTKHGRPENSGTEQDCTRSSTQVEPQIIPVDTQMNVSEHARSSHEPSENHQITVSEPSVLTDDDIEAVLAASTPTCCSNNGKRVQKIRNIDRSSFTRSEGFSCSLFSAIAEYLVLRLT